MTIDKDSLRYHRRSPAGKVAVRSTKPTLTAHHLSMAYTPGVAAPCREIHARPEDVYTYTARGNLVAVVSNGTAVLGLGNIGPFAAKPVMEGKGVLFKRFADIDVFDLELDTLDPEEIIRTVELIAPGFGGVNLEDIKAPECFLIEKRLQESCDIPVFHDDQHGTAIISAAALINALEIVGKSISEVQIVLSGAGAAGIACAEHMIRMGADRARITLCDSRGIFTKSRCDGSNLYKEAFARDRGPGDLAEALRGADVFLGVSVAGIVTPEMVRSMASDPIVLALANPDPEISYFDGKAAREDVIMATGRSDFPNQVNNVLGFPFIFRGALDVRARAITDGMKVAASRALAALAREPAPDSVSQAYGGRHFSFGREYLIPKPFDPRVLPKVASAVAEAAVADGVARRPISDWEGYRAELEARLDPSQAVVRTIISAARDRVRRIVFPEGEEEKVLRAAHAIVRDGIARPILLGRRDRVLAQLESLDLELAEDRYELIDTESSEALVRYAERIYEMRRRKGITIQEATFLARTPIYFGCLMVETGDADGLVAGLRHEYPRTVRPALEVIGMRPGYRVCAGFHVALVGGRTLILGDTAFNVDPSASALADIAGLGIECARLHRLVPRVAFLSHSNFGSARGPQQRRVVEALAATRERFPDVVMDGEMQADTAVNRTLAEEWFPFSSIRGDANVLIFPSLGAANAAYKLLRDLAGAHLIGPIVMGLEKPVNVVHRNCSVDEIVAIAALTSIRAD